MAATVRSDLVQVTNISPTTTTEQLRTLFGHIGVLSEFTIYSAEEKEEVPSKVAYIRYAEPVNAEVALHLNNTVFLDRALIVLPLANGSSKVPDEKFANLVRAPANTAAGVLPRTADWPLDVISMVVGRPGEQVINTIDPRLSSLSFPLYPPLPATTDGNRIEEIRRTILVSNLDPKTTGDQVLEFFNKHAEVRCVRMAGTESDRAAYVEFSSQPSIVKAFGLMGATLNGRQIMVQHSSCAIIKPANNIGLIEGNAKAATAHAARSDHRKHSDRYRSRSRSRDHRSRSPRRSTSRRRRSRSRDRRRSRSRHAKRGSRTRSRSRNRKRHSRSASRERRRAARGTSRSKERRKLHRSRSPSGKHRSSRSHSRNRSRREREKERGSIKGGKDHRDRDSRRGRDKDEKDKHRDKDRERRRESRSNRPHENSPSVRRNEESPKRNAEKEKLEESTTLPDCPSTPPPSVNDDNSINHKTPQSREVSDSEFDNGKAIEQQSPCQQNGSYENEDPSSLPPSDTSARPVVLGVKLAGPEDMDPSFAGDSETQQNLSPNLHDSDSSGDEMDTEA